MTPPVAAGPAVETRGLTRRYRELLAVDHVDLVVPPGEIFGLLGPNGAGKTTTIKMLTTLLPPSAGSACVAGFDVASQAGAVRRSIGYVPQLLSADGSLTGRENLQLSARLYHLPRSERRARIDEGLAFIGLTDAADRLVREYSGGMIRRLELAQAMLHRPAVLFLDEPTLGLDPVARALVWGHVRRVRDQQATTIFLTTNYLDEADALCDRIAVMNRGSVGAIGSPRELKAELGPAATLDDVFRHVAGTGIDAGGTFGEVARTRRTARRLG